MGKAGVRVGQPEVPQQLDVGYPETLPDEVCLLALLTGMCVDQDVIGTGTSADAAQQVIGGS